MTDRHIPVLVRDREGTVAFVALGNDKSVVKSVERREVWLVQPHTGRVLPFGDPTITIDEVAKHQQASLTLWADFKTYLSGDELSDARSRYALELTRTQPESPSAGPADLAGRASSQPATGSDSSPAALRERGAVAGEALNHLAETIHERRQHRPEGSYTTHLFEKGEEKIRKKLGEEAIEVLLAPSDKELTYEVADLIFHLMVLLEVRGLTMDDVIEELRGRF